MATKTKEAGQTPAAANGEAPVKRTKCPITREQFAKAAQALRVSVGEQQFVSVPRTFSTGSMGWNVNEKMTVVVDGTPVKLQINCNVMVVGSKELPKQ